LSLKRCLSPTNLHGGSHGLAILWDVGCGRVQGPRSSAQDRSGLAGGSRQF
jgi:hypothetical protein